MVNFLNDQIEEVRWDHYLERTKRMVQSSSWIFRGQSCDGEIKSPFERALNSYRIPLSKAPEIEKYMIREFRRKYDGNDIQLVAKDTLYCLSLMQHHGCPTRLFDWTYSPHVAAFFAVRNMSIDSEGKRDAFVFCLNHRWINESAKLNINNDELFKKRFDDKHLKDYTFRPLYMEGSRRPFIVAENPHRLHRRLSIQRGVFVIQGDISLTIMQNISLMKNWENKENLIRFKLLIRHPEELKEIYSELRLMNITNESLFPGLDGFSESLKQNLFWYRDLRWTKDKVTPYPKEEDTKLEGGEPI